MEHSYEEIRGVLYQLIDAVDYMKRISSLHDCNDCGKRASCEYAPRAGEYTRINCPLWKEAEA